MATLVPLPIRRGELAPRPPCFPGACQPSTPAGLHCPATAFALECIYEGGILRPLVKVDLEEGKKVRLFLKDEQKEILDKR